MKVIIIAGSKSDLDWAKKIKEFLNKFEVESIMRIASAHKTPLKVLNIISEYEKSDVIFITIAGRSNALSAFIDSNTTKPVIACPPITEKSLLLIDLFSSLRMPSGVAPLVVLEPENAALAALKIIALNDKKIENKLIEYQNQKKNEIEKADKEINCENKSSKTY